MKIPSNLDELTALFEKFGARSPGSWARSQLSEGINQLQRFLFLRQAWGLILREDDMDWVQFEIARAQRYPDEPNAGVGHAPRRCVEKGASAQDLTHIVRGKQAELLHYFCYLWATRHSRRKSSPICSGGCLRSIWTAIQFRPISACSTSPCSQPILRAARCDRGKRPNEALSYRI